VTPTIEPMVTPTVEPIVTPIVEPTMTSTTEPITTQPAVTEKPVVTEKPISLKKKTIKIGRGEKVAVPLNNGTGKKITYLSKNKKIATVTSKGVVKGVKTGTTTIYVKANGKKYSLKVIVKKKPAKIKITSVKSVKMGIGDKLILQAVLNKGAASYSLTWKSSNKKVVTVNSQGVATIKGKGKATITVKTYNGFTAKLNLNIK
ncbi:MAG: Ig-like domain-containing protein, partial [Lachnospiraceae bacterium]|nr:Ig-like domain-containing protein [Lachnospiraceae bacterium]